MVTIDNSVNLPLEGWKAEFCNTILLAVPRQLNR